MAPYVATGTALYGIHLVAEEMGEFLNPYSRDAAALKASYVSLMTKLAGSSVATACAAYGFTRNYYATAQHHLMMRFWAKIEGLERLNSRLSEKFNALTTMLQLRTFCMQNELHNVHGANTVLKEALQNVSKISESKQLETLNNTTLHRHNSPRKNSPSKRRKR